MMRAHGIHPNGGPGRAPTARQPKIERTAGPTTPKRAKNKTAAFEEENMNVDDEEEPPMYNGVKSENTNDEELLVVKTEPDRERMVYEGNEFQRMRSRATPETGLYSMADNGYESGNSGYTTPVGNSYGMAHLNSYSMGGSSEYGHSSQPLARQNSPSEQTTQYPADPIVITD